MPVLRALLALLIGAAMASGACGDESEGPTGPRDSSNAVTSVEIRPTERTIGILGKPIGTRALAFADDGEMLYGSYLDPDRFSWSSTAPEVATIGGEGPVVTGLSEGTTTIIATTQGVSGRMTVTVRDVAEVAWSVPVGTGSISSGLAIGGDGTIYVGTDDFARSRSVWHALSPLGDIAWALDLPLTWPSTPAIGADGALYLGSRTGSASTGFTGRLIAMDPGGSVRWTLEGIEGIRSSPAIAPDGTIVVAGGQHVYAVDPGGEIEWSYENAEDVFVFSAPAIAEDGTIYVGGEDLLYAIDSQGALRWTLQAGDLIQSSPTIGSDGVIYFGSVDGRLHAIDPDGTERWSVELDPRGVGRTSPSIGPDGTIYVGAGALFAIDPGGSVRWRYGSSMGIATTPILGADGNVYVGTPSGILALDAQGRLLWDYSAGGRVGGSVALGMDGAVVGAFDSAPAAGVHESTVHAILEHSSTNGGFMGAAWPAERGGRTNAGRAGG